MGTSCWASTRDFKHYLHLARRGPYGPYVDPTQAITALVDCLAFLEIVQVFVGRILKFIGW